MPQEGVFVYLFQHFSYAYHVNVSVYDVKGQACKVIQIIIYFSFILLFNFTLGKGWNKIQNQVLTTNVKTYVTFPLLPRWFAAELFLLPRYCECGASVTIFWKFMWAYLVCAWRWMCGLPMWMMALAKDYSTMLSGRLHMQLWRPKFLSPVKPKITDLFLKNTHIV